jgi:8-oxo-dGTP diphosphatase
MAQGTKGDPLPARQSHAGGVAAAREPDIRKSGAVILGGRRFLVVRARGKDVFVAPGGKLEQGETSKQALVRELREEVQLEITEDQLEELGTFQAPAAGQEERLLEMKVFLVNGKVGKPLPASEIEEIMWINSKTHGVPLGSIFEHDVLPLLKGKNLID